MRVGNLETWAGPGQAEVLADVLRAVRSDLAQVRQTQNRHTRMIADLTADVSTERSLKTDVATLKTDVATLKTDVATLKTDVATLTTDVAELRTDVATLKTDMTEVKTTLAEVLRRLPETPA